MTDTPAAPSPRQTGLLKRRGDDFPFYSGEPVEVDGGRWWIVLLGVAAGYAALILTQPVFPSGILGFIPAILFCMIPLCALASVAGTGWTALFRPLRWIDAPLIVAFYLLNLIVTLAVGWLSIALFDASANPAVETVAGAASGERVLFFLRSAVQLLGEELFTIVPFLVLLAWLVTGAGVSRTCGVVLSALAVAVIFALVHLPTYNWNLGQVLVGLVPVRIVLLLPYLVTKNVWVSTGVHVLNDWVIFGLPLLAGGAATE